MLITNAKYHDGLADLFSNLPVPDFMSNSKSKHYEKLLNENKRLKKKNKILLNEEKLRTIKIKRAQNITRKIIFRTTKNVSLNLSSVFAESVPYIGIGAILAVTASDVYDGCETIKESNELLTLLNTDGLKKQENKICGLRIPTEKEVLDTFKEHKKHMDEVIGGTIYEMIN